ncbi:glycosyltransferase family 4 protein [Hyphomicrobiales bacterium]
MDGFTMFNPVDSIQSDLIHAFNRIPLNAKKFVIGFESHLPRLFGNLGAGYQRFLYRQLLSKRCVKIVGISEYARANFLEALESAGLPEKDQQALKAKLDVRYPNMDIPPCDRDMPIYQGEIHLTFVGNHFSRKGGCTVVRMAELALERKLPFIFNIVSALQCGGSIWTDPSREEFYRPYLQLLSLPNVRHHKTLPNKEVVNLLERSHFSILTTFADTFGYSAIESMAKGTPVICTSQGALPEFVKDGINGFTLAPAVTAGAPDWRPDFNSRGDTDFEKLFAENVERLAQGAIDKLQDIRDSARYANMRHQAYSTALEFFDSRNATSYWDNVYELSSR